ncbi:ABC transporter substrate-binding protein [Leifsonia sp. Root227]|uniref:ABC transporter substrate-binding protein n=1 Tax=unclassified Leifsonia TaxID=2663824 RepID=UPI0006F87D96|nr:ABC transporter substrate-binding protein [Leifsonia sp. Root227]KRC49630.1 ABC transporter substrate-binding protein [Leifsonia sp. Root227]
MTFKRARVAGLAAAATVVALSLAACTGGANAADPTASKDIASAADVKAAGGMDALIAAAKKEGTLNIIATPGDWANYQEIFDGFTKKYGITINPSQDSASSQEEIDAAKKLKGQDTAPDTFDIGSSVALANTEYFAPYKPTGWDDIPADEKESTGLWKVGYYGVMAVGYDANKIKSAPKSLDDLLGSEYKGAVALNGNPTQAAAAAGAVAFADLQAGGTLDDLTPGIDWFAKLKKAGNWNAADGKPNTIASGETPVLLDWSFNQKGYTTSDTIKGGGVNWKYTVLPGTAYVGYYNQAINKDAPHPAAARLWEEYLYSDAAQNAWLKGGAYPARVDAMEKAGTLNKADFPGKLDKTAVMTDKQATDAGTLLNAKWANAVG